MFLNMYMSGKMALGSMSPTLEHEGIASKKGMFSFADILLCITYEMNAKYHIRKRNYVIK